MTHGRIPPFRLVREPLDETAAAVPPFEWAAPDVGTRNLLGGDPTEPLPSGPPPCPRCHGPMTFYGQLDSISDDICIADVAVIQVYLCFDCFEPLAVIGLN